MLKIGVIGPKNYDSEDSIRNGFVWFMNMLKLNPHNEEMELVFGGGMFGMAAEMILLTEYLPILGIQIAAEWTNFEVEPCEKADWGFGEINRYAPKIRDKKIVDYCNMILIYNNNQDHNVDNMIYECQNSGIIHFIYNF